MRGSKRGLILVHTGAGKGKTTAALGQALRAAGHGIHVAIIQFMKGKWKYGELAAVKTIPHIEIYPMGTGFTWEKETLEEDRALARDAWEKCKGVARSGRYGLVIFDEINYAMHYGLLPTAEVAAFLKDKPQALHIVLTGRNAPKDIVDVADMVTEMKEVKHHFAKAVKAQKGIDY